MKKSTLSSAWRKILKTAADPVRAQEALEQLAATPAGPQLAQAAAEQARALAALFSGSPAMTGWLLKHPGWLEMSLTLEPLRHSRREQGLRREIEDWLQPALATRDWEGGLSRLRQFRQREMLRIAARDLGRLAHVPEITREISDVADVCLGAVLRICQAQLRERLGVPYHPDPAGGKAWQPTQFAVIGLGKLGGQELNYSSDVDVMFVYSEEGFVFKEPPRATPRTKGAMASHQFYKRLAEAFIAEVARSTADGMLYRIDLRLRPEGGAGPLARSVAGYENFYAQWGQTWERMMLIKARCVAGDATLAGEWLEMIQPFRHPRSMGEGALREIAAMKSRIEDEVVRSGELDRNVKLGRGGIREIEFVVQTLQLLHAGRQPFLQGAQTLPLLQKLAGYKLLTGDEARALAGAYCFLRDAEHRVQMEQNLQTHTLPAGGEARRRLAALMGFADVADFDGALRDHARRVRQIYEKFLQLDAPEAASPFPKQFRGAETEWRGLLAAHGFKDVERSLRLLQQFAHGPGFVHVSARTTEMAMQFLPRLLKLCPSAGALARLASAETPPAAQAAPDARLLSDPDRVLARLDTFISAYGARAMLFETWTANPALFELLLLLFDRSEFLAEVAIRTPDLLDDLVLSGRLGRRKHAKEILRDLRHGRDDADQALWMRRYHEAEFMRIGLRDILGLADTGQNLVELTALADACLGYALEVVTRRHRLKAPAFALLGLGRLGGGELNYGSDLDIAFVAPPRAKSLPRSQRMAAEVMELLSARTGQGIVFQTDARLRPDGEKGLLVNTLDACEEYYRRRAQFWEIQALTRVRAVAGHEATGRAFIELAGRLADFTAENLAGRFHSGASAGLASYTPDWKREIAHMRRRIEKERTPAGKDALAIKTGAGGLVDAEFLAQALCLEHGWQEPNTLRALERARAEGAVSAMHADGLIEAYLRLRRVEGILRRWSFEGEAELPAEPAPYYRVSVRCGFRTPEDFREAVAAWRKTIRAAYDAFFVPDEERA